MLWKYRGRLTGPKQCLLASRCPLWYTGRLTYMNRQRQHLLVYMFVAVRLLYGCVGGKRIQPLHPGYSGNGQPERN